MSPTAVATESAAYTHCVCGRCWRLLYCSGAKEWDVTGYGWCPHESEHMHAVFTDWPDDPEMLHRCNGEMRPWLTPSSEKAR